MRAKVNMYKNLEESKIYDKKVAKTAKKMKYINEFFVGLTPHSKAA